MVRILAGGDADRLSGGLRDRARSAQEARARARVAAAIVAVLGVILAVVPAPRPAHAFQEDTIVQLVNEARWAEGQAGLLRNGAMDSVALGWAQQLAAAGTLSHNPDYASQIPGGWVKAGENVASGYGDAGSMHEGWMNSPGHRKNILGEYTDIGVAFIDSGGSTWGVQVFANYPGNSGPAAPPPPPDPEPAPPPEPVAPPETPAPTPTPTPTPTATATATPTPTITLRPTPTPTDPSMDPASDAGALPVMLVIVAVLLLVGAGLAWFLLARRRKSAGKESTGRRGRRSLGG